MNSARTESGKNVYGITYATFDDNGLHFESELAIQLHDGPLVTLKMPTQLSERQAISQLVCGQAAGCS